MAGAQQELASDNPEAGEEQPDNDSIHDESCDAEMPSSESHDETTTEEEEEGSDNEGPDILLALRNHFGIDSPCTNLQTILIGPLPERLSAFTLNDWSCDCQFCGPVIPKVLEIANREFPWKNVVGIKVYTDRFEPLQVILDFEGQGNSLSFSLYTPTFRTPTFIETLLLRNISTLRHVQQDSSSLDCFNLARHWLQDCEVNHEPCRLSSEPDLPKRFLAISRESNQLGIRLVTDSGLQGRYAALSHCWGKLNFLCLTTDTLDRFGQNIPWRFLPKTFQDAIKVCLELGLSSIWIDSLCILQDSRDDWEDQSACMAEIYRNATIVIAANSASGAHEGFLGIRKELFVDCIIPPSSESPGLYARPKFRHYSQYNVSDETLESRAWAYQERILARRYLSFNKRELHWECESIWHCECGESEWRDNGVHEFSLRQISTAKMSNAEIYKVWRHTVVSRYSGRLLTVASDRFPALSAVTQVFQNKLEDTFLAGLWKGDLVNGQCWIRDIEATPALPRNAPSWSWSSVSGGTFYYDIVSLSTHYSHPIEAECLLDGKNAFGEVKEGFITFRGPLVEAFTKLTASPETTLFIWEYSDNTDSLEDHTWISNFHPDCLLRLEPQETLKETAIGSLFRRTWQDADCDSQHNILSRAKGIGRIWCLYIGGTKETPDSKVGHSYALVLGISPGNPERFVRLGISLEIDEEYEHRDLFANAIVTDVTIE